MSLDRGVSAQLALFEQSLREIEQQIQTQDLRFASCQAAISDLQARNDQLTRDNAALAAELARAKSPAPPCPVPPRSDSLRAAPHPSLAAQISAVQDRIDAVSARVLSPDEGASAAILAGQQQIRKDLAEIKTACAALAAGDPPTREALESARDWNQRFAALTRAYFAAVRQDAREMERLIRVYYEQLLELRKSKRLARDRMDIDHPLVAFLEKVRERMARPPRAEGA
jgi:septal ring factor EnvC (AmiA/AmiB activator)